MLALAHPRYGYKRITALKRSGWKLNRKRVLRIWRQEGLSGAPRSRASGSLVFPARVRQRIGNAADRLGLGWCEIYSAAGHDARQLHYQCDSGMIFVPCRGGISHNESEWVEPDHLTAGTRVLTDVLWSFANDS